MAEEKSKVKSESTGLICVIRITGQVGLNRNVIDTLDRLRLKRKYSCIVLKPNKEQMGMIKVARDFVAFGEIDKGTLSKLIKERGQIIDKNKKVDPDKAAEGIERGKKFDELNLKPFFRLHPPRKGISTKLHFGIKKGVLGNHGKKINELLERML